MKPTRVLLALMLVAPFLLLARPSQADQTYIVQPGDTLYSIARRFGVSLQEIAAANNIVNPNLIYAGASLVIPDGSAPPAGDPAPTPVSQPPPSGSQTYTVQRGDTLFRIAVRHQTTIAVLAQLNGIGNVRLIYPGQVLRLPGSGSASGGSPTPTPAPQPTTPAPGPNPTPEPTPAPGANLLPNPSFEEGYRHLNGIPELQVPNGWHLGLVEGAQAPGTGLTYLRPESRALPRWLLPASEHSLFIYQGDWTLKVFKGGAPIRFSLYTDVYLQPGTYRFTAQYFPDLIRGYGGGGKVWATEANAGEVAFIRDGAQLSWSGVQVGARNSMVQTFTVSSPGNVRLGVAFRTRYALTNNGFFMDQWTLERTGN